MSEINLIEAEMHGIKVKGTVSQIAELKKLLDEQNLAKLTAILRKEHSYNLIVQEQHEHNYMGRLLFADTTHQNKLNTNSDISTNYIINADINCSSCNVHNKISDGQITNSHFQILN